MAVNRRREIFGKGFAYIAVGVQKMRAQDCIGLVLTQGSELPLDDRTRRSAFRYDKCFGSGVNHTYPVGRIIKKSGVVPDIFYLVARPCHFPSSNTAAPDDAAVGVS